MGFRQADGNGQGGWARLWSVDDKGNYSTARISTSRKQKDSNTYETDFSDGFVRLVGEAHKLATSLTIPEKGIGIQITSCETTKNYSKKTQKEYVNFTVFGFKLLDGKGDTTKKPTKSKAKSAEDVAEDDENEDEDEDLPF